MITEECLRPLVVPWLQWAGCLGQGWWLVEFGDLNPMWVPLYAILDGEVWGDGCIVKDG